MEHILVDTDIILDHLITNAKYSTLMRLISRYDCFTTVIDAIEVYELS